MEISRELLKKYALGTCTDLERKAVENWLSLDEGYNNDEYVELFESRKSSLREPFNFTTHRNKRRPWSRAIVHLSSYRIDFII